MSKALVERLNAAEIALRDDRPYAAVAIGEAADRIEAIEAREARLSEALRQVRHAIMNADPAVLTDTFWMPDNVFKGGTVVDFIDAALSGSGSGWRECATEGCDHAATVRFERGGVGSDYCHACYMRIQALPAAPQQGGE